jgi:DNA primase catalytic subunit
MPRTSIDECLRLLADRDRRRIVEYLHRRPARSATLEEVTAHLQSPSRGQRDAVREKRRTKLELVHADLPKLAAHDIVEWDRERDEIRYRPDEAIEDALEHLVNAAPDP